MTGAGPAGVTPAEASALSAIDTRGAVGLLLDLLAVPSVTGTDAESELQHVLARCFDNLGLDTDLWPLDLAALAADPDHPGTEAPRSEGWGLVGTTPGSDDDPVIALQGHVDVVPPGDPARWAGAPFDPRIEDGVVHGRGACDMKAGLVANIVALQAIRDSGVRVRGRVALHSVVSEEDGGLGAFATLRRGHRADACLITEPTSGTLTTANGGALTFELRIAGRATHASTRTEGVSAIDAYLPVHAALRALESRRNRHTDPLMSEWDVPHTIDVGLLRAGDWSSSVPDLLVAGGRLGVRLDEDPADARADLEDTLAEVAARDPWLREHPVEIAWTGGQFASGRLPAHDPLRNLVGDAHATLFGERPRERGAPYGSDLRLYAAAGIPTLHYGPGDVRLAHSPWESVPVDELERVAQVLVLTVLRALGTA